MHLKHIALLCGLLAAGPAFAQAPNFRMISSPVVNSDNTVTFNYRNDNAKSVSVDVQFAGTHEMTRDADGVWTITLGPAAPDIYPYCFKVDGISVMDPSNPDWFPNEGFKNSLLDIRGQGEPLVHALKDVPHGAVDYVNYYSHTMGLYANAIIYTPPFYDQHPEKKYPVMFLISGTTDTEEVYYKVGKMNLILDNLIAEGKAKEMILVLPYGNPIKYFPSGTSMWAMGDMFGRDLVEDLLPYVESNYRTIQDRHHRGIGGFSRGGNQGLAIGLTNLDKFSYLCSYSSFTSMDLPGVYDDPELLNKKIHLFWLGVGTDDFLYGNAKEYMDFLDSKGIDNIKIFTDDKFGHTWMNAKYWLDRSFRLLFQEEPVPETEKIGPVRPKPVTPANSSWSPRGRASRPSGDEQRLTPEVMARLFPMGVVSPEYNADGSVTFRFQAENAEKVELECQMFQGTRPMVKDQRGVWTITVKPDVPDIYPYCFQVDGTQVADPNNMFIFPNESFKYSLADVRGPVPAVQDLQDVPHGKVAYRYYHSDVYGFDRCMCVYTPAGYDPAGDEKLPVLYLIHGMTDTYETWFKVGHVNNIMDNLINAGLAERMVVVMPYANPAPEMAKRGIVGGFNFMGTDSFTSEIIDEVMPFVESNYNVLTDPAHRAIAGFSLGGRQTMACGLANPDKFNWVCAFAPAIFGEEYKANFENGTYASLDEVRSNLKLFFLGTGKDDFLIEASRGLHDYLLKNDMPHVFYNPAGGHTWMNCRDYIELVARRLFREEGAPASSNINANGYPRIMDDNSVVFKFRGPADASPVVDLCGKKYSMLRDPEGFWTCRTDPQVPGFHYYALELDGVSVCDPASETYYGCGREFSAIEIPEPGCELFEMQDVPHGQVRELNYYSELTKSWRPILVYTPAGYEKGNKKYPVVYIHHGGGEDHRGWMNQGRVANIIDNLVAAGEAKEMIVVSVNSNVPSRIGMAGGYNWAGMQPYREELVENIIPFVEKTFRVKKDRRSRAMCGLSMGGGQSFYIGLRSPELFANVGLFSSGIFGGIAGASNFDLEAEVPGMLSATGEFNSNLDNFFISCGEQDPRIEHTRAMVKKMKNAGVEVEFASYPGDHEWQVWRKSFAEFARMLF